MGRLRDAPDALLIVHQASSPDEHLSAATQDMLHLAEFNADHALGMAGVWLFGARAMPIVASSPWPLGGDVDLTRLGRRIGAAGGAVHVELAESWRQYGGDPLELLELNRIVLDRLDSGLRRPVNNGNRIEGRVWIHEAATVHASVIVGPTVIGRGARVADSYIGPYTSIGERACVEGAEVERSIISAGASVKHVRRASRRERSRTRCARVPGLLAPAGVTPTGGRRHRSSALLAVTPELEQCRVSHLGDLAMAPLLGTAVRRLGSR